MNKKSDFQEKNLIEFFICVLNLFFFQSTNQIKERFLFILCDHIPNQQKSKQQQAAAATSSKNRKILKKKTKTERKKEKIHLSKVHFT